MQKFIVTILFLILMPFYSWAVSLEELQSNPERYIKMNESQSDINYMDVESIQSLRYEPPYYTLQGDIYGVVRDKNLIFKVTEIFCYDYRRCTSELAKSIRLRNRNISNNQLNNALYQELKQDSGIVGSVLSDKAYDTAGTFLQNVPVDGFTNNKIVLMSKISYEADYMFYRYYGQHFLYG